MWLGIISTCSEQDHSLFWKPHPVKTLRSKGFLLVQGKDCLAVQETRVQSLVQGDPTCLGATKPARHTY